MPCGKLLVEIEKLIAHLQRIAKANNDKFAYKIEIGHVYKDQVDYTFICYETADKHCFYGVRVDNLNQIKDDEKLLKLQCESWGYKYVE